MVLAFTGAGISSASHIPTFQEQPGIRDRLTRRFATQFPEEYQDTIRQMEMLCEAAAPNDAHLALAEYGVPIITMNVDRLHQRAGSAHVTAIHGALPNIVLYGDPAPRYQEAFDLVTQLQPGDTFLIIGTSFYTAVSVQLRVIAMGQGATIHEINEDAEHQVRAYLSQADLSDSNWKSFLAREIV